MKLRNTMCRPMEGITLEVPPPAQLVSKNPAGRNDFRDAHSNVAPIEDVKIQRLERNRDRN